jgi:hypothetical protein
MGNDGAVGVCFAQGRTRGATDLEIRPPKRVMLNGGQIFRSVTDDQRGGQRMKRLTTTTIVTAMALATSSLAATPAWVGYGGPNGSRIYENVAQGRRR